MMRRAIHVGALASIAALIGAAPSGAGGQQEPHHRDHVQATNLVTMPGRFFHPSRLTVLVGDTVVWRNDDDERHTVDHTGGAFSSGDLPRGARFEHRFAVAGTFDYVCAIHRLMHGQVRAATILLEGPRDPVVRGGSVALSVRTAAGAVRVTIERLEDDGRAIPVADGMADAAGRLRAVIRPLGTARYRARTGDQVSEPLLVTVTARASVALSAWRTRRGVALIGRARPRVPTAQLVLQLYSPERFSWRQVAHAATGASEATFRLSPTVRRRARVALRDRRTRGLLAVSRTVDTWRLRSP